MLNIKNGTFKNIFPKMIPARNWNPQQPSQPTIALPCPKTSAGAPAFVWPGMVLSAAAGASAWTVGVTSNTVGSAPAIIAIAQDPTVGTQSMNVVMTDSLVGLPCTGNFRICTPFYKRGVAYSVGTPLTAATVTEQTTNAGSAYTAGDGSVMTGCVRPAAAGEAVIGYVTQDHMFADYYGAVNYDDTATSPTNATDKAFAMRKSIDSAVDSLAKPENSYFIEFDTAYQPVTATPSI